MTKHTFGRRDNFGRLIYEQEAKNIQETIYKLLGLALLTLMMFAILAAGLIYGVQ